MKKAFIFTFLILFLFAILCACTKDTPSLDILAIESLENRVAALERQLCTSDTSEDKISDLLSGLNTSTEPNVSDTDSTLEKSESVGFKYSIEGSRATITGYTGEQTALVIPATIDGYRVVAIGDSAFKGMHLKSVIVSDGVESIGWFAFEGCAYLTSVTLPKSVISIGHGAFGSGSSLTLYCHANSFSAAYAKSYGITYAII